MACTIKSVQKRTASREAQNKGEGREYVEIRMACDGMDLIADVMTNGSKIGLGVYNPISDKEREAHIQLSEVKE